MSAGRLREIAQRTPDGARWFNAPDADLFVWDDDRGTMTACQFAWRDRARESVFLWSPARGAEFARVNEEAERAIHPGSAILETAPATEGHGDLLAFFI